MKQEVPLGQVDYTVLVKIRTDAGAPATGLDEGDIDIAYARVETDNDVTTSDVTPAALTALTDAHTDWGFEEVSATDHPGVYRLDVADAVFASGAWSAVVSITGAGLDPADLEFVLVPYGRGDANVAAIAGSTSAASALERSASTIVRGTVDSGASTTSIPTSSLTPAAAVDDQFRGRVLLFSDNTTTAELRGQGSDISASTAGGTLTLAVALTDAPVSGDSFVIV